MVEQLHHDEVGVVGHVDGVALWHEGLFLHVARLSLLHVPACPWTVDHRLAEQPQVFLCGQRVAAYERAFCQSLHHAHVSVVGREHVVHHGRPFAERHVAEHPVEFVHVVDDESRRLGANLVEGAQVGIRKAQQIVGQLAPLCAGQVVEERHLGRGLRVVFHHGEQFLVVAEVVFVVGSELFFQIEIGFLQLSPLWQTEDDIAHDGRQDRCQHLPPPLLPRHEHGNEEQSRHADGGNDVAEPVAVMKAEHGEDGRNSQGQQGGPPLTAQSPLLEQSAQQVAQHKQAPCQDDRSRADVVVELCEEIAHLPRQPSRRQHARQQIFAREQKQLVLLLVEEVILVFKKEKQQPCHPPHEDDAIDPIFPKPLTSHVPLSLVR